VAPVRLAVLVPVKRFSAAKGRLANVLDARQRAALAEWMATGVVQVAAEVPTFVACDDDEVADWAQRTGANVIWGPDLGLNSAVDDGVAHIVADGYDHVLVSHADLAIPGALLQVPRAGCITLVPDRRHDGTNVMSFPAAHPLRASYGRGSFARHLRQAMEMSHVAVEVRGDPGLSLDLDTANDLVHPAIQKVLPPWLPTNPANPSR
jgi:2-phospho-L-lactate guanylyltransferase